jgi:hypothetical protein
VKRLITIGVYRWDRQSFLAAERGVAVSHVVP